ncbi:hypothetical protein CCAX7_52210 [Capsulimonas corticalis]|uniref:Uncharacterized protein n=1 Tax=Capsulimonas corticalis TaxID=2219043 RepID=A0A402CP54_9BACT|nr:hypothetical protein [Capsulimonas corticalis]BDI33170.1 hypothetical protein CCAX7_52210 [Capsulimonas corticalis]
MPDNKDDSFLGGGIKFNSAGAGAPTDIEPVAEVTPQGIQPHQIKAAIIVAVVAVLLVALFVISIVGLGGTEPTQRHHSGAPTLQKPEQNDKTF